MDTCCRFELLGCNVSVKPTLAELAGILSNPSKSALSALFLVMPPSPQGELVQLPVPRAEVVHPRETEEVPNHILEREGWNWWGYWAACWLRGSILHTC